MSAPALFRKTQIAALAAALVATAAFATDGSLDSGFSDDGKVQVSYEGTKSENFSSATIQKNSTDVLTAGFVNTTNGSERRIFIARLAENGALVGQAEAVPTQPGRFSGIVTTDSGEVLVTGSNEEGFPGARAASAVFVKFSETGALLASDTFPETAGPTNSAYCGGHPLAEPDGDFVVPCGVLQDDGVIRPALLRLNNDLSMDQGAFGGDGVAVGTSLNNTSTIDNPDAGDAIGVAVARDGSGGYYLLARDQSVADAAAAQDVLFVQHFNADGTLDSAFGENGVARVITVAAPTGTEPDVGLEGLSIQRSRNDGKIYVGGRHFQFGEQAFFNAFVARLNPDGTTDGTFNADGNEDGVIESASHGSGVMRILQDGANRVYVLTTNMLVRLLDNGATDDSFPTGGTEVNTLNRPANMDCDGQAPADDPACYTSEWRGALVLLNEQNVLLLGGTATHVADGGTPSHENAIVVNVRADAREVDTTPDQFTFAPKTNQALNSEVVSDPATITGINSPASVEIAGGTAAAYSIGCTDTFTSDPGTITNGETICVRQTSASTANTETSTTVTIGGVPGEFKVTTGDGSGGGGGGGGDTPRRSGGGGGALSWLLLGFGIPAMLRRRTKQ